MKKMWFALFLLALPCLASADIYLEIGLEGGGETFASASSSDDDFSFDQDLNIGGGFKLAGGYARILGEESDKSISLAFGYLWDSIDADNGDAEFDTFTVDAIFNLHFDNHHVGIGATYHIDPHYEDDIDGLPDTDIDFDDAAGLILQYRYQFTDGFYFGLRRTEIDYEIGSSSFDASSTGLFVVFTGEL
ncbi:MAG: hypothetical protein QNJ85_07730 [Gammaproteobacteria bacterium]|nr:hypothetical protein [Gammaproteobacteria bacterium]